MLVREIGEEIARVAPNATGHVKAILRTAEDAGVEMAIIQATEDVNEAQKRVLFEKIQKHYIK